MIFVSGMTPRKVGKLLYLGKVVPHGPIEAYRTAVELARENAVQAARALLQDDERLASLLNLTVYLRAERLASGFLSRNVKNALSFNED